MSKRTRASKAETKPLKDHVCDARVDVGDIGNLFECVNRQAGAMIAGGDPALEHFALTLECIAEKGIRATELTGAKLDRIEQRMGASPSAPPGSVK